MKDNYLSSLADFEILCSTAIDLSIATQGREVETWREEYASHIFSKICLTAISILKLLPGSSIYTKINNFDVWDISSVSTLARSLIETFNVFYYLIIDDVDKEELDFRFILWEYHEKCERIRMLELIGSNNPQIEQIKASKEKLQINLIKSAFYQKLDSERYKKIAEIRTGKTGIFLTNSIISEKAGISLKYSKAVYKNLSNYVHTLPYSLSVLSIFNAENEESKNLFKVVIEYCSGYLSLAIRNFVHTFPDQTLSKEIIEIIEDWEYIFKNFDTMKDS